MAEPASVVALALAVSASTVILPVTMVWVVMHADEIGEHAMALARRCHLARPRPVLTYDPPIERIAADLRRISTELRQAGRGTSAVVRQGLRMAYDDKLTDACRALGLPHALGELTEGMDRELERIRVEGLLEQAGLRIRSTVP